jgi:CRISPR-associated protein Cas2
VQAGARAVGLTDDPATTTFLVAYDIERETVRRRVAETCEDYGLVRIQWSVFMGPLRTRYHAEVMEALARRIAGQAGTIDCFMICGADVSRRRRLAGATVPAPARTVRGRSRSSRPTVRRATP